MEPSPQPKKGNLSISFSFLIFLQCDKNSWNQIKFFSELNFHSCFAFSSLCRSCQGEFFPRTIQDEQSSPSEAAQIISQEKVRTSLNFWVSLLILSREF